MATVRAATAEDLKAISRIHEAAVQALASEHYTEEDIDAWTTPGEEPNINADDTVYLVAEEHRDVIGFGSIHLENAEITGVYVHPDQTGRGIGAALLEALEQIALEQNIDRLTLDASLNAVKFYEREGYETIEQTTYETDAGVELPCVKMDKSLL